MKMGIYRTIMKGLERCKLKRQHEPEGCRKCMKDGLLMDMIY